jgi:hypothetical protein
VLTNPKPDILDRQMMSILKSISIPITTILIAATALSLVGITVNPIYNASAKECGDNSYSKTNDENNNDNGGTDSTTCTDKKDSNDHEHSATTAKDSTPFRLPMPFP